MTFWQRTFVWCVDVLEWGAKRLDPITPGGMDYVKINVLLFCIVLPVLFMGSVSLNIWLLFQR
jgi:hypothetical protein